MQKQNIVPRNLRACIQKASEILREQSFFCVNQALFYVNGHAENQSICTGQVKCDAKQVNRIISLSLSPNLNGSVGNDLCFHTHGMGHLQLSVHYKKKISKKDKVSSTDIFFCHYSLQDMDVWVIREGNYTWPVSILKYGCRP